MQYNSDIQRLQKLGEGSYGSVYKAKVTSTGQVVAIKVIHLTDED